jgi:NADPH-dependent ferric siderophore reductase
MQRITFGGAGLAGFPEDSDSAYLKLVFTSPSEAPMALRSRIRRYLGRKSFAVRSYTVRRYDPVARRLDIDFVLHDHSGVASSWARGAKVGDVLPAHGPGPKKLVGMGADWFLIIGDMSALPAISANLERLPPTARGYALIEILDEADRQELDAPPGMELRWLVNPNAESSADTVLEAVRALPWHEARCEAWLAGELETVRRVRSFLKKERGVSREQMYASSYWQLGRTDEQHRQAKSVDQMEAAAD